MAYDLFFLRDYPALGVSMPTNEWEEVLPPKVDRNPEIERFLGAASRWQSGKVGRIGYGKVAEVFMAGDRTEIRFPLKRRTLRKSILTLGTLLGYLPTGGVATLSGCGIWLEVGNSIQRQYVGGFLSRKFRNCLEKITPQDLALIRDDMEWAWEATAPKFLLSMRYFGIGIRDRRFEIGFADGSACDVSMYPDNPGGFSCHNLDSVLQQAICLAGLFSLYERVKQKT